MKPEKKLYLRVWKNGPPRKNIKLTKLGGSYNYKGFRVTLWDNHIYNFRYEWSLDPLTQTAKVKSGKKRVWDPTSSRFRKGSYGASYWAKVAANEIHAWSLRRWWKY